MENKEGVDSPSPGKAGVVLGNISFNGMHQMSQEMAVIQGTLPGVALSALGPAPPDSGAAKGPIVAEMSSVPTYPIAVSSLNGIHQINPELCTSQGTSSSIVVPLACSMPSIPDVTKTVAVPSMVVMSSVPSYPSTAATYYALMTANSGVVGAADGTLSGGATSFGEEKEIIKKRGRPIKYGPHGNIALSVSPFSTITNSVSPSQKRGRGRPPGSGKNQQLAALGGLLYSSAGVGFMPHAITVVTGEDVAARIISLSQQGPRGICVLSANGAISNVMLWQPAICNGTVTIEGRFEILSLSGSFLKTEVNDSRVRSGGLSVSLAGPDGRVIGGKVTGVLIAASPVQVILGSFLYNSKKMRANAAKHSANQVTDACSSRMFPGGMTTPPENEMKDVKLDSSVSLPGTQGTAGNMKYNASEESSQGQEDE